MDLSASTLTKDKKIFNMIIKLNLTFFFLSFFMCESIFSQHSYIWHNKHPYSYNQLYESIKNKPIIAPQPRYFIKGKNINDSIKNRLLYLLNCNWTLAEFDNYVNKQYEDIIQDSSTIEYAQQKAKNNNPKFLFLVDSVRMAERQDIITQMKKKDFFKVNDNIVYTVAFLDYQEAIPILSKALNDSIHYNKEAVQLALARFGNKEYQKNIISTCIYNSSLDGRNWERDYQAKSQKLIMIATQESIYQLNNWLDTTKTIAFVAGGRSRKKLSNWVVMNLFDIIENKDFYDTAWSFISKEDYPDEWNNNNLAVFCKKWLIENKGKYIINRNFYPY